MKIRFKYQQLKEFKKLRQIIRKAYYFDGYFPCEFKGTYVDDWFAISFDDSTNNYAPTTISIDISNRKVLATTCGWDEEAGNAPELPWEVFKSIYDFLEAAWKVQYSQRI